MTTINIKEEFDNLLNYYENTNLSGDYAHDDTIYSNIITFNENYNKAGDDNQKKILINSITTRDLKDIGRLFLFQDNSQYYNILGGEEDEDEDEDSSNKIILELKETPFENKRELNNNHDPYLYLLILYYKLSSKSISDAEILSNIEALHDGPYDKLRSEPIDIEAQQNSIEAQQNSIEAHHILKRRILRILGAFDNYLFSELEKNFNQSLKNLVGNIKSEFNIECVKLKPGNPKPLTYIDKRTLMKKHIEMKKNETTKNVFQYWK